MDSELPLRSNDRPYIWLVIDDAFPAQGSALTVRTNWISPAVVAAEGTEKRRALGMDASPKKVEGEIEVLLPAAGRRVFVLLP